MSGKQIYELEQENNLSADDIIIVSHNMETKKCTLNDVFNLQNSDNIFSISDNSLEPVKLKYVTKKIVNKFNKDTVTEGTVIQTSGATASNPDYCIPDYISVSPSTTYHIPTNTGNNSVVFYNENKEYISGTSSRPFTTPSNAKYVRFTLKLDQLQTLMMTVGATAQPEYIEHIDTDQDYINELDNNYFAYDKKQSKNGSYNMLGSGLPLFIETYYKGGNQPMHPKIIDMGTKWNGYRFWMAYTPLPFYDEAEENPCIACSNDLIEWITPGGNIDLNPLDTPKATGDYYLSDTHLLYNNKTNKIEVWYRGFVKNVCEKIYRRVSSDGVTWEERENMFVLDSTNATNLLCPTVIFNGTSYDIWVCERNNSNNANSASGVIIKYNSTDGYNWVKEQETNLIGCWHFDIIKTEIGYEMLNYNNGYFNKLFYCTSNDGITWENKGDVINIDITDPFRLEFAEAYRATFLKIKGRYYVFTGRFSNPNRSANLFLSVSQELYNIFSLQELPPEYRNRMARQTRMSRYAKIGTCVVDSRLNKPVWCIQGSTTFPPEKVQAVWCDANGNIINLDADGNIVE